MKTKVSTSRFFLSVASRSVSLAGLIAVFACAAAAQQWTGPDASNNISNANSGNVGIGTIPAYKLDVSGTVNAWGSIQSLNSASSTIGFRDGDEVYRAHSLWIGNTNANGGMYAGITNYPGANTSVVNDGMFFAAPYTNNWDKWVPTLSIRGTSANGPGNVGIGTTSPLSQLHFGTLLNAGLKTYTASSTDHGLLFSSYVDTNSPYRRYGDIVAMSNQDGISGGSTIRFLTNPNNSFTASERMRIDYLGNVGIGTTSPNSKLEVQGNFSVTGGGTNDTVKVLSTSSVSGGAFIQNTQGSGQAVMYVENNRGSFASYGGFLYGGSNNAIGNLFGVSRNDKMFLFADGASNLGMAIGTLAAQPLILGTSNAERMRVDPSGNVGIGINNPTYKLHVQDGQINASGGLCINGQCKGSWSEVGGSQWSGSSNIFYNTGNVGIGTDSPGSGGYGQSRFDVVGRLRSRAADANMTPGLWLNDSPSASGATDQAFIGRSLSATTGFWNATGWVLNVHDSGKVGIGTESPEEKLHVTGNIKVTGTGNITALGTIEAGNIKAKYQDLAEWVPSSEQLAAGTVVVLDTTKSNQVIASNVGYDTRVAGVISAQPGITLGESGEGKVLVATTGRVKVKVDASRGAIQIGDLLVTSDVAGVAMKSEAVNLGGVQIHRPGTIIGKALEPLAKGSGQILVLLSLQ